MDLSRGSRLLHGAATAILLLAASPVFAQWTGKGQVGVALTTGNGDSLNANAKVNARHVAGDWEQNLGFTGVYASDDDRATSQMWEVEGDARYNFNARTFWFGGARYQDDRFSGFKYQGSVSGGIGRRFIDSDRTKLAGRIGLGYKFDETRDTLDPVTGLLLPGTTNSSLAGVAGLDWDFKVTDTTRLYDYFYVEAGSHNTFFRNEVGVAVSMTSRLALALAYTVRHNTDPPIGFDRTETLLTANLVYEVK
jgi:putative salt-induced outer membrane protein